MPINDVFLDDELSTTSSEDAVIPAASSKSRGANSSFSSSVYSESSDSSEDNAWSSSPIRKKPPLKHPRYAVSGKLVKKTPISKSHKQFEYEGVTDSDSDSSDEYSKERTVSKILEIPLVIEKGRIVDSLLEFNAKTNEYLVKWKHRSYRETTWEVEVDLQMHGRSVAR